MEKNECFFCQMHNQYIMHLSTPVPFIFISPSSHLFYIISNLELILKANLLAFKGFQRIILDKEVLQSERDQLAELLRLQRPNLLKCRTQSLAEQIEQENIGHSQEATQLHIELVELILDGQSCRMLLLPLSSVNLLPSKE